MDIPLRERQKALMQKAKVGEKGVSAFVNVLTKMRSAIQVGQFNDFLIFVLKNFKKN